MKNETIIIRTDEELKKRLQEMAEKDHRTLSDFIRLQLEKLAGMLK
ncbi:MAG TPA: ribbon-helix-helix protein, CopG family [Bacteroidia bacterium]|nr:ribbon-helix-helix protein, CopG family [Bacteroidia bacterium]